MVKYLCFVENVRGVVMIKVVFFDFDDIFVDIIKFVEFVRRNVVENMVRYGFFVDFDIVYNEFFEFINEYGSNFGRYFDYLFRRFDFF